MIEGEKLISEIKQMINHTEKMMIDEKSDQVIFDAFVFIPNMLAKCQELIKNRLIELAPQNDTTIRTRRLKISYRKFRQMKLIDDSVEEKFITRSKSRSLKKAVIKKYFDEHGEAPQGIFVGEEETRVSIDQSQQSKDES